MTYGILFHPGHNRVYFETSLKLSVSEFAVASGKLSVECGDVKRQTISDVEYLTFHAAEELPPCDVQLISGLSFVYALFKLCEIDGERYLKPLALKKESFVEESIGAILKYAGKTNEIFTRMLINVAYCTQSGSGPVRLLDPIAGKGTTLYEGLIKGYDVAGIEIGDQVVNESYHFLKRFFETARYKFEASSLRISGPNKSFTALRHTFRAAKNKEDWKSGAVRTVELVAGNSVHADRYYKKNTFDLIVGDLPYGVAHGNVTNEKQSSLTRNPSELLKACLPAWNAVLKPGGALALSWNTNVLAREDMKMILERYGFDVKNEGPYLEFGHRVDQAINRDIAAAVKR